METLTEAWGDLIDRTQFLYDDVPQWFGDYGFSATTLSDRADGKFFPVYQTEQDLAIQRAQARALCGITRIHDGAVDAMANYIFGSGFGFEVTCQADTAPGLVGKLQAIIDEFLESNSFAGDLDRELHRRSREDGEAFARLRWGASGALRVQVLEPDQITEPADPRRIEEWEGLCGCDDPPLSWTFGVAADAADSSDVVGYYVRTLDGMDWEFLRPCHVEHFRRNVPRNAKRGVTDFYGIFRDLVSEAKLRNNSTTGAAVQAAIAWIVQHAPGVTSTQAAGIGSAAAVGTYQQPASSGGTNTRNAVKNPPGTILRVGAGQEFKAGPMGAERNAGFVEIAQYALRAIGQRWSCPEYIISGDASNANYASSLVAESPFVKARQADQQWYGQRFVSLLWKAIEMHWRRGVFDRWGVSVEQMRHWCDIVVNFPSVESRDPLKIAQTHEVLDRLGLISPATMATQQGLDIDEELRQGAKRPAPTTSPFGMPGLPGMPPKPMAPEMLAQQAKLTGGNVSPIGDTEKSGLTAAVEAALESVRTSAEARAILEQLTEAGSWKRVGGASVFVDGGKITKGCPGLKGESISGLINEPTESRERREHKQAQADAKGLTGKDVNLKQVKDLEGDKYKKEAWQSVKDVAKREGVKASEVLAYIPDVLNSRSEFYGEREALKRMAHKNLGLSAGEISKLENQHKDHSNVRGFDDVADEFINNHPEAGVKDTQEFWDFVREKPKAMPKAHHLDVIDEAGKLASEAKAGKRRTPKEIPKDSAEEFNKWYDELPTGFVDDVPL